MKGISALLFVMSLLLLSAGCDLTAQTPQIVVVTATPEPTATANPGPAVPTWTPGPTWTPQPSPTPTKTPFPTSTPTLLEQARMNATQCIDTQERSAINEEFPEEILPSPSGSAFVKAGFYGSTGWRDHRGRWNPSGMPQYYRYWRYEPGPVPATFACKEISFQEYPAPTLIAPRGEARIMEVAGLADESCRNWIKAWQEGNTFLNTQSMMSRHSDGSGRYSHQFPIGEIRPATEDFALVFIDHKQQVLHRQLGGRGWNDSPIYMVYSVADNSCSETAYSAQAWHAWPNILPEIRDLTSPSTQEVAPTAENVPTETGALASITYEVTGPTAVTVGNRYQYLLSGPANAEIYVRWYKDGQGIGAGSYTLGDDGTDTAEWDFTESGEYTVNIYLSGASGEQPQATLSGIVSSSR